MSGFTLLRRGTKPPAQSAARASIEYLPQAYPEVEAAVDAELRQGKERVVLNLDTLAVLDTEALRGIISLLRRARLRGAEIALQASQAEILRILSITGLDRVFAVV